MDPLANFPEEIALHVLSFLPPEDVARAVSLVCKSWHNLAEDILLWQGFFRRHLGVNLLPGEPPIRFEEEYVSLPATELEQIKKKLADKVAKVKDCKKPPLTPAFYWKEQYFALLMKTDDFKASFFDENKNILGCAHYQRDCKVYATCCGRFFVCRHCHNQEYDYHHTIDRYAVRIMMCMFCNCIQPAAQHCQWPSCRKSLGRFWCASCVFWDNDSSKQIVHCTPCNVCKLVNHPSVWHCFICHTSLSKNATHTNCQPRPSPVPHNSSSVKQILTPSFSS
ncbi:RING finger and CHY zinc finger domain-containing protein 1 [Balamuthia mandrillaris]